MASRSATGRAYHHGDLKAALKEAALALVRRYGPRGFSLNQASRLAGVTVAAPYRHFADKEALLAEIACDGNRLLEQEVRAAVAAEQTLRERMIAAGMAYLHFAAVCPEYFSVIFNAGINKLKYPEVQRTGLQAFSVIAELSAQLEGTAELGRLRALSAWALVHGLATLRADGALDAETGCLPDATSFRPVLESFLAQPLAGPTAEA